MTDIPYTLVSFDICPFVQKARILFEIKGIAVPTRVIDLENKPDWFLERSPTGKVPVLLHGDDTIFESSVILEYIEETTANPALPADALGRARERAWAAFADDLIMTQYRVLSAKTEAEFETHLQLLFDGLQSMEQVIAGREPELRFLECAIAPVFSRICAVPKLHTRFTERLGNRSELAHWSARILSSSMVKQSLPDRFPERLATFFGKRGAVLFP